jgi:hypothetical protein
MIARRALLLTSMILLIVALVFAIAAVDAQAQGIETEITLDYEDKFCQKGQLCKIWGEFKDSKGHGIEDEELEVRTIEDGETKILGTVVVGDYGGFEFRYGVPFEDRAGKKTLEVEYKGSTEYEPSNCSGFLHIYSPTTMVRVDDTIDVTKGEMATFEVALFEDWGGELGYVVPNKEISALFGSKYLTQNTTDENGTCILVGKIPDTLVVGEANLNFNFQSGTYHHGTISEHKVYIRSHTKLKFPTLDPRSQVEMNQNITGELQLTTTKGEPVVDVLVKVYWYKKGEENMSLALSGDPTRLIVENKTDANGKVEFEHVFTDGVQQENDTYDYRHIGAVFEGDFTDTIFDTKSERYIHCNITQTYLYKIPAKKSNGGGNGTPDPPDPDDPEGLGILILVPIMVIVVVLCIVGIFLARRNRPAYPPPNAPPPPPAQ